MIAHKNQERFQSLMEVHKKILYKICHAYCQNPNDREDLAQEIVVHLWQAFDTFDGRCQFSTWMYRVSLNIAISFHRRETTRTRHTLPLEERILEITDEPGGDTDAILLLYQFIATLDPLTKALVLLYLDGNSYQEIADILGISHTNVATKISRLKQTMKRHFNDATLA